MWDTPNSSSCLSVIHLRERERERGREGERERERGREGERERERERERLYIINEFTMLTVNGTNVVLGNEVVLDTAVTNTLVPPH